MTPIVDLESSLKFFKNKLVVFKNELVNFRNKLINLFFWHGTKVIGYCFFVSTAIVFSLNLAFNSPANASPIAELKEIKQLIEEKDFDIARSRLAALLNNNKDSATRDQALAIKKECDREEKIYNYRIASRIDSMLTLTAHFKEIYKTKSWDAYAKNFKDLEYFYQYAFRHKDDCNALIKNPAKNLFETLVEMNDFISKKEYQKTFSKLWDVLAHDGNSFEISQDTIFISLSPDISSSGKIHNYHSKIAPLIFAKLNFRKAIYRVYDNRFYENEKNRDVENQYIPDPDFKLYEEEIAKEKYIPGDLFKFKQEECEPQKA